MRESWFSSLFFPHFLLSFPFSFSFFFYFHYLVLSSFFSLNPNKRKLFSSHFSSVFLIKPNKGKWRKPTLFIIPLSFIFPSLPFLSLKFQEHKIATQRTQNVSYIDKATQRFLLFTNFLIDIQTIRNLGKVTNTVNYISPLEKGTCRI